jgi:hypothetical protein
LGLGGRTDIRCNRHKVVIIAGSHNSGHMCAVAFDIHGIRVRVELLAVIVVSHNVITTRDFEARSEATAETGVGVVDSCNESE